VCWGGNVLAQRRQTPERLRPAPATSELTYARDAGYLRWDGARSTCTSDLCPPVKVGTRIVWKRIDVEHAWEESAFRRDGRPEEKGGTTWADPESPASTRTEKAACASTSVTRVNDFATALREEAKAWLFSRLDNRA
jgi:hypothetical protein